MAVETSEGSGAGAAGELRAEAELEMKKEREMGGEIEHIACRDGDDNDGSGTDGSFVMVMNGGDSDARSDSSEKDMEMDARGSGGAGGAGDLLAVNSGSSTFVDDVRVEEGEGDNGVERQGNEGEDERKLGDFLFAENQGKGDDVGGGEDDAHGGEGTEKILAMPEEPEEVIEESAKTDHEQKDEGAVVFKASKNEEEHEKEMVVVEVSNDGKQNQVEEGLVAVEDSKDEKDAVVEELDNKEEVVDEEPKQVGEEVVIVEDSKNEKDAVIEDLNNEDEAMAIKDLKNEEQYQVEEEVVNVEDSETEKETVIEDLNNEDEAMAIKDLKNEEQNQVEEEVVIVPDSKNEKETVFEDFNKEDGVIMGTEEQASGGTEVPYVLNELGSDNEGLTIGASSAQSSSSDPVDRNIELESVFDKSEAIESAVTKPVKKEVESDSEIEELKKASEQKSGDVESSITEKKEADSASEIEERRDVKDEVAVEIDSSELAKEEISSAFEIEDRRDDNHKECEDVDYLDREAAKKGVDSLLDIEESKITNDGGIKDVESEITDHMGEEVASASEVGDRKIARDDLSNCFDWEKEKKSVIQVDENLQIKATPAVSDGEGVELNTSVEQAKQHNANASLPKSEIEEKEHNSSIELIDEPDKNSGSAFIVEEYQVVEASSIGQSTESAKEFITSTSRAKDESGQALSTSPNPEPSSNEWVSASEAEEDKNAEMLFIVSNPEPKEDMDLAPKLEEKQDLDASLIDSNPEPIKKCLVSTSEVEEIKDADASSIDSIREPVKEDVGSASKSGEIEGAKALLTEGENEKRELKSATELADVVKKPVRDLEGIEDQTKDLKAEEQGVEDSRTEIVNEKRELKSTTELTEPMKIHLDKDLGETEEQQKELKSEIKHDAVHIQQPQGNTTPSAPDGDGEKTEMLAKKYRIIKIPRFTQRVINDELQAKISDAQVQVDEHTRSRDSLKAELDSMRKVLSDYFHKRDTANEEEKKAKALVNAKRLEMDSIQTVISKGKAAASFLDIISQIHTLEHKMQHETISLKDEKKCLHELNQLKHEREVHLLNKCSQSEIDETLKQKETAESSLRALKKEFDILRIAHLKADEYSKATNKSYIDQFNKVKEHEQKWKTANELRQKAYKNLHGLKSDKMEHYWKYMDDRQAAKKYASLRDLEALERHCTEQVERIMHLWNEDDDFRKQYVESNVNNTFRKFGTLDGRTPGPNDEKLVLPSRVSPPLTTRSSSTPVTVREGQLLHAQVTKPALPTNQMVRSKLPSKSTSNNVAAVIAPSKEEFVEVEVEKKLTKEEEEQARLAEEQVRKEEELRKEREALELKEKLKMVQKAKAKEAEERKRRKVEKAQARAEYKAQKEAEQRELKRAKKEKKKEDTSERAASVEGDPASVTETSSQEAVQERESNNRTSSKKSRRQSAAALNKYNNKVQPVPLPLRNRGKRRMSSWIWALCAAVALVGLFFAGNYISFSVSWLNFGF